MRKLFLTAIFSSLFALATINLQAQEVEYEIIKNAPQTPVLSAGVNLGDIFLHFGDEEPGSGGPGAYVIFRPISRLELQGQLTSGLYGLLLNDMEDATGLRKTGGLFVDINGEFAWRRKGVNQVYEDGSNVEKQFHLSGAVTGVNQMTEKYIDFPYNRLVERTIRGGIYSHTYPFSTATGGYIGIGKYYSTFAKLKIGDKTLTDGMRLGYSLDYVLGAVNYVDDMRTGDSSGFRFGLEFESYRRINTSFRFEFGGMPGVEGGFMRVTCGIGLFKLGSHDYKGDYRTQKASDSKIVNLFRAL